MASDRFNYDDDGNWVAPINRAYNSEAAQQARGNYIGANEQWQRLQNRHAPPEAIARAEQAMKRAGDAWERACQGEAWTPGALPPMTPVQGGQSYSRPSPDPALSPEDVAPVKQPGTRMGLCRSCHAPVLWGETTAGKPMPLDPEPREDGNVSITQEGKLAYKRKTIPSPGPFYVSHFATCPDAKTWRAP